MKRLKAITKLRSLALTDCACPLLDILSLALARVGSVGFLKRSFPPDFLGRLSQGFLVGLPVGGSDRLAQNGLNLSYIKLTSSRSCGVSSHRTRVTFLAQFFASAYFLRKKKKTKLKIISSN